MLDKYLPSQELAEQNRRTTKPWLVGLTCGLFGPVSFYYAFKQRSRNYVISYLFTAFIVIAIRSVITTPLGGTFVIPILNLLVYSRYGPMIIIGSVQWYVANKVKDSNSDEKQATDSKNNRENHESSENPLSSLKKSFAKLTTEFPASETIQKIESLYSLSSQKAEEIYKNTVELAKKNNRINPLLSDLNEILKSSSLSELVYSRNGNLVKKDKINKEVIKKTNDQKVSNQKIKVENSAPKNVIDKKVKEDEVILEKVNLEVKEEKSLKQKLEELKELFDQNLISEEEYASLKGKLLNL